MQISWWRTNFGEEEINRIAESIHNEHISQGAVTEEFERKIADTLGVPYAVATTSGSMAILMTLIASGIKPGDEVIVPNRGWIAAAHAPFLLGAKVILIDVEPDRPLIDVTKIKEKITPKTKAVIPVHLNGRSVNMPQLNHIAAEYGLTVIEDAAQAFYSRNSFGFLGCQSDMGCFSLSVAKLIATGQGGFIVTKNKQLHKHLKLIRTHGVSDLIRVSYTQPGFNFRFNDILASIGLVQLAYLKKRISRINEIYHKYEALLKELDFLRLIPVDLSAGEIPIYIEVLVNKREKLMRFLAQHNIQTRPFYPDLDRATYLGSKGKFSNSRIFAKHGLFLPSGPGQSLENIAQIGKVLKKFKR